MIGGREITMPDQLTTFSAVLIARETLDPHRGGHVVWPNRERFRVALTFMEDSLELTGNRTMGPGGG